MRKILVVAVFIISSMSFAQTVNGIPLKDIDVEYIQIVGTSKFMSNKLTIEIDFGQKVAFIRSSTNDTVLKDEAGENLVFNSMIDALNYLTKHGFEFVQAYAITVQNQNVYHYLLRKKN